MIGVIFFFKTLKNPDNFIRLFLASIIIGPGIKIAGYPLIDEYWVIMLLFGLFMRKIIQPTLVNGTINQKKFSAHEVAFIFLTLYFLFQSFRGGLWLDDIRMFRWVIFFIIVGISFFVVSNQSNSINPDQVTKFIIYSSTIYFLLYYLSGFVYELITGMSKFDLQDDFVAGSSVATFPVLIYLIALLNFFQRKQYGGISFFLILSFIIVSWTVVYYDSRSAIFTILGVLGLNFLIQILNRNKKVMSQIFLVILFFVVFQIWSFNISDSKRSFTAFLPFDEELYITIPKNLNSESDRSRILAPKTAFTFVTKKISTTFFGYGWYMNRYEMIEPIREMRKNESMLNLDLSKKKPYQSSAIIALLVDTGFVGVFLFLVNLLYGFFEILKTSNKIKYIIGIAYLSILFWSFVGTITPLLLFYFWVMPNNPIILMLEKKR